MKTGRLARRGALLLALGACALAPDGHRVAPPDVLGHWRFDSARADCRDDIDRKTPRWTTDIEFTEAVPVGSETLNLGGHWTTWLPDGQVVPYPGDRLFTGSVERATGVYQLRLGSGHQGFPIVLRGRFELDGTATGNQVWTPDYCFGMSGTRAPP